MAINPFLSFATGALRRREDIRDERAESAGELLDVVSDYYFTQTFPAEQAAIKNDNELYKSIAVSMNKKIILITQKNAEVDDPYVNDLYSLGCESKVLQLLKLPDLSLIHI